MPFRLIGRVLEAGDQKLGRIEITCTGGGAIDDADACEKTT